MKLSCVILECLEYSAFISLCKFYIFGILPVGFVVTMGCIYAHIRVVYTHLTYEYNLYTKECV
jgi:hypothetical protein